MSNSGDRVEYIRSTVTATMGDPETFHPGICSYLGKILPQKDEPYEYWRDILAKVPASYEFDENPGLLELYIYQHGSAFLEGLEQAYGPRDKMPVHRMLLETVVRRITDDRLSAASVPASSSARDVPVPMPEPIEATAPIHRPHFGREKIIWLQEEAHAAGTITLTTEHTWEEVKRAAQKHYEVRNGGKGVSDARSCGKPSSFWSNRTAKTTARPDDDVLMRIWYMGIEQAGKSVHHTFIPGKTYGFRLYKDGKTNIVSIQTIGAFKFTEAFVVEACCSLTVIEIDNSHGTVMEEKLTVIGEKNNSHGTVTGTHVDSPRSDMSSGSDNHKSSDGASDSDSTASEIVIEKGDVEVETEKVFQRQVGEKKDKVQKNPKGKATAKKGAGLKRKAEVPVMKAMALYFV